MKMFFPFDKHFRLRQNPYIDLFLGLFISICLTFMTACSPFQPKTRTYLEKEAPQSYSLYTGETQPNQRWWLALDDPELNRLIDAALSDNFTLKEAWARLRQARAIAVQAGADLYPTLSGEADALLGRTKSGLTSSQKEEIEVYTLGLASSYEVDLWGRVRAQQQSAYFNAAASREDLDAASITLAAEVADRYIQIISQRAQKLLLQEQLRINTTLLELVDLRFRRAIVSALDVYQQKQVVEDVKAGIPLVEEEEQLLLHQLAVLLGKPPRTKLDVQRSTLPELPPLPPTGIPADTLSVRPDVRAAGLRLKAADWQVTAARANRLPALSLTARGVLGEGSFDILFDSWLLSLAGNLSAPILDGGRRAAEVERSRAVVDEDLAFYRDTVLLAVKEVEDALISEAKQREHIEGLEKVMAAARRALEQAGLRYQSGLNDYLPVLTQLLTVQGLERDIIRRKAFLISVRIRLYRALGGTWTYNLTPPSQSATNYYYKLVSDPAGT
jgi:NodT family efflux transporter outer membrane factor (OMF) lipoprotein